MAVSLVPLSSLAAVARKSAGASRRPGRDRDGRDVGGGQQPGQAQGEGEHDHGRDGAFLEDVVAPVGAAPGGGVGCRDGAAPEPSGDRDFGGMGIDGVGHAAHPDEQDVRADDGDKHDRDEHDVPHEHLAEVHHVEERADSDGVECVLAAGGDPLGVEVLLGQVPGKALDDRGHERDHAGDPGPGPAAAPGGHPELAPQVDDQQRHEQLDAPYVQAVEEVPERVVVPPVRAAQGKAEPGHDRYRERGQGADAEHVYPGCDIGGLAVGQQLARRQYPEGPAPEPGRPHAGGAVISRIACLGRAVSPNVIHGRVGNYGVLVTASLREREQQRGAEDADHHRDQNQVRHRYLEYRPVQRGCSEN